MNYGKKIAMTRLTSCALVFGLFVFLNVAASTTNAEANHDNGILDCFFEINSLSCAKERTDAALDTIEEEIAGRQSSIRFSKIFEEAGALVVDGARSLLGQSDETADGVEDNHDTENEESSGVGEARKKKFGKKKKKMLQKIIAFSMLVKSKISLILQLISTHIQMKFFALAVIGLLINVARLWINVKKDNTPAKVIYYEHAQHQHHYDHDDDHGGYWGRSGQVSQPAQEMAYNAYQEKN